MSNIRSYTFEEFAGVVYSFHGAVAPGVMVGGFMVELAYQNLPTSGLFDAICETAKCLPDSVQLLTPCTIGNGWLKIIDVGRFAITFYDKHSGEGVRVYIDCDKIKQWPHINNWFMRLEPKQKSDQEPLVKQIEKAGMGIMGWQKVKVDLELLRKRTDKSVSVCSSCKEAYYSADGNVCPACAGKLLPYVNYGVVNAEK